MRVKHSTGVRKIPEVNLVPMMDVLMTILTFFIILSMTLTGEQISQVQPPKGVAPQASKNKGPQIKSFMLGVDAKGQILLKGKTADSSELVPAIKEYFRKTPDGQILVVADRTLPYQKVTQILQRLRDLGGGQVSLAISPGDAQNSSPAKGSAVSNTNKPEP
jgi:biopolymer transport protein ExbD